MNLSANTVIFSIRQIIINKLSFKLKLYKIQLGFNGTICTVKSVLLKPNFFQFMLYENWFLSANESKLQIRTIC